MKNKIARENCKFSLVLFYVLLLVGLSFGQRQMEALDRGLVAVRTTGSNVFLSWRVLGTDPVGLAFNIYRDGTRVNASPITGATNLVDASGSTSAIYTVRPVLNGVEQAVGGRASVWGSQSLTINLQRPAGGTTPSGQTFTYVPNDIAVSDLDGDGQYDLVLKWEPSNARDNSQTGYTGNVILDAYRLDGTRLWRIDLGRNIRAGAHYTQIVTADFDGDGFGEVAVKTAPNTRDGTGAFIRLGPAAQADHNADYRNSGGFILQGPEYLTVFHGRTGRELATANYNPGRGTVSSWGDGYGNRVDRFNAAVAWLDGVMPSMVFQRGYYTRLTLAAWDFRNGQLTQRWFFDSNNNSGYAGQGNHNIHAGDVTGDGRDDILLGSSAVDANGRALWRNGLGHGDASHLGDLVPSRPGLELWSIKEAAPNGTNSSVLVDARTGAVLWGYNSASDVGRGLAADIDASNPGHEFWSSATDGVYSAGGSRLSTVKPSVNFRIYWDGDLQDEILDGTRLDKWTGSGTTRLITPPGQACNGTKNTPNVSGDLLGDWREEVITHNGSNQLYLTTTTILTTHRLYTLMHDPVYRASIGWQNASYNQPPHLGFALGLGVQNAPRPNIVLVGAPTGSSSSTVSSSSQLSSSSQAASSSSVACVPTEIISHVRVGTGVWQQSDSVIVPMGETLTLGPQASTGGIWAWSGPGNLTTGTRELTISDIQDEQAGVYLATYTNTNGCRSTQSVSVQVQVPPTDCNAVVGGQAVLDNCGRCVGGNTGRVACAGLMQGEDFCLADGVFEDRNTGFFGRGYLNLNNQQGGQAQYALQSTTAGTHTLAVRYSNNGVDSRAMAVLVNGTVRLESVDFTTTGSWTTWNVLEIPLALAQGRNIVTLRSLEADGGPNLDLLGFLPSGITAATCDLITGVIRPELVPSLAVRQESGKLVVAPGQVYSVMVLDMQGKVVARLGAEGGEIALRSGVNIVRISNLYGEQIMKFYSH